MKSNENINLVLKYIEEHLEYVIKRRLIKASEDILSGDKIIDVAFKYGWQSHGGFTKAFVKEFDFVPSLLKAMKISMEILGGSYMSHVFLFETKVGQTKEELFELLKCKLKENGIEVGEEKLQTIYNIACGAYDNVKRYSGEEYITHLLNVAIILAELGAEEKVIFSGMFCDVARKGIISLKELKTLLDKEVYDIVQSVNNVSDTFDEATDEVMLIKLAERLHNMRTIEFIDELKKREKAKETIDLYMPLARKLNNQKLIDEMNDLVMKYISKI